MRWSDGKYENDRVQFCLTPHDVHRIISNVSRGKKFSNQKNDDWEQSHPNMEPSAWFRFFLEFLRWLSDQSLRIEHGRAFSNFFFFIFFFITIGYISMCACTMCRADVLCLLFFFSCLFLFLICIFLLSLSSFAICTWQMNGITAFDVRSGKYEAIPIVWNSLTLLQDRKAVSNPCDMLSKITDEHEKFKYNNSLRFLNYNCDTIDAYSKFGKAYETINVETTTTTTETKVLVDCPYFPAVHSASALNPFLPFESGMHGFQDLSLPDSREGKYVFMVNNNAFFEQSKVRNFSLLWTILFLLLNDLWHSFLS